MSECSPEEWEGTVSQRLEQDIRRYIAGSAGNRPEMLNGTPVYDEPLIGFADGDDPLFDHYKEVVADIHLTPREVLEVCAGSGVAGGARRNQRLSVVSIALPITHRIRLTARRESSVPSPEWSQARWHGMALIEKLSRYVVALLEQGGYRAVAPQLTQLYEVRQTGNKLATTWSHTHAAYAAGLGTYSLSGNLITSIGTAFRCTSIVTDMPLPPSPKSHEGLRGNCLLYREGSCRRCIQRCPAGAISENGLDWETCAEYFLSMGSRIQKLGRIGQYAGGLDAYLGCGLCQTKVPCEDRVPPSLSGQGETA